MTMNRKYWTKCDCDCELNSATIYRLGLTAEPELGHDGTGRDNVIVLYRYT